MIRNCPYLSIKVTLGGGRAINSLLRARVIRVEKEQ